MDLRKYLCHNLREGVQRFLARIWGNVDDWNILGRKMAECTSIIYIFLIRYRILGIACINLIEILLTLLKVFYILTKKFL